MKTLDQGKDKVAQICDALRRETLEPAKREAKEIVSAATKEADRIVKEAEKEAVGIIERGREELKKERSVFASSLEQGAKQSLQALRQDIERKLFSDELQGLVTKGASEPKVVAALVKAIVEALEKDGLEADLTAVVPKSVSVKSVLEDLGAAIAQKLGAGGVQVGMFAGGAQVRLEGKKMTIDITDSALKELLARYVRKDFRTAIFGESNGEKE
ncbi:V-type ATP synthase subunit E [Chlamydiales bacterium SCGC AG-110-P3]|nr:V-type ATP synthase subunit E [Chlamydiales bacterium SCGC AG-110-P3]